MKPRRLALDFSGRGASPTGWGMALLILGAALSLAATSRLIFELNEQAQLNGRLLMLGATGARIKTKSSASVSPDPGIAGRAKMVSQVTQSLQSPWADLLEVIEVKPAGSVALLSVEPSAAKRTVRITAEARDAEAMLTHLSMLQSDTRLVGVTLLSHQQQVQAKGAPWRYQLQGAW